MKTILPEKYHIKINKAAHVIVVFFGVVLYFLLFFSGKASGQYAVNTLCGTSTQGNPLAGPNGICISPDGTTLFLADYTAHRIKKIIVATGAVSSFAGNGTSGYADGALLSAQFSYPSGIKISSDGLFLYICDNNNCLIRKIDLTAGMVSTIAGVYNAFAYADSSNGLNAMFNQPTDLAIVPGDSVLYVTDPENQVIRKINLQTTAVTTVAGTPGSFGATDGSISSAKFHNPNGICISSDGNILYVADAGNHKIRKIDLVNAQVSTVAGNGIAALTDNVNGLLASFNVPKGVCVLPNDSLLYIMDTFNDRIRQININTTAVTTIAGSVTSPTAHFADNSNGLLAKFYHPVNGVLSGNSSKIYISDQENFRVRVMNTDIAITSVNDQLAGNTMSIYPNPFKDNLSIHLNSVQHANCSYSVITLQGDEAIREKEIQFNQGSEDFSIPVSELSAGVYFLRLMINDQPLTMKIIKIK